MTGDQENFVKMTAEALRDWRESLGGTAWVILALVAVALIVLIAVFARHLWRSSENDPRRFKH